jgi:hypothetical protein
MADAEQHVKLAEAAAETLDYGQERLYAGMARALLCQARGDYQGMAVALGHWQEEAGMDDRSRLYGVLWRPLLVEGLAGSGRLEEPAVALKPLRPQADGVAYLEPGLAWLEGWLAEQEGDPDRALDTYQRGDEVANKDSRVYSARLCLALGRLLHRTGQRRATVEPLAASQQSVRCPRSGPVHCPDGGRTGRVRVTSRGGPAPLGPRSDEPRERSGPPGGQTDDQ